MKSYVKLFEEFINEYKQNFTEEEIRDAAWLYFLVYPYSEHGMKHNNWYFDKRMGITFEDSMERLSKKGLVKLINDTWYKTDKSKESYNLGQLTI